MTTETIMAEKAERNKISDGRTARTFGETRGQKDRWGSRVCAGLSVWALLARSSIYKILGAVVLVAAGEYFMFTGLLQGALSGDSKSLEQILDGVAWPGFLILLGVVYCILALTQWRMTEKSSNVLMRLRVEQPSLFCIRAAYNVLCLVLVFAVQIVLAIGLIRLYARELGTESALSQTLFLTFYRSRILHCLLPMAEAGKWVRNLLSVLALGMEAAGGNRQKRTQAVMQVLLFCVAVNWFVSPIGVNVVDILCDILCGVYIAADLYAAGLFRKLGAVSIREPGRRNG